MPYCTICGLPSFERHGTRCSKHTHSTTQALIPIKDTTLETTPNYNYSSLIPTSSNTPTNTDYLTTLSTSFLDLSTNHAISRITATISPTGTRSITIDANTAREQCSVCRTWFADRQKLDTHKWEFPCGCSKHGMCFTKEDEYYHGVMYRHERCFVKGCQTLFRREGGWKESSIRDHVKEWHWS